MTGSNEASAALGEGEAARRAADDLSDVLIAMEDVDLNPLLDDDVRAFLDAKEEVSETCRRLRRTHHSLEDGGE